MAALFGTDTLSVTALAKSPSCKTLQLPRVNVGDQWHAKFMPVLPRIKARFSCLASANCLMDGVASEGIAQLVDPSRYRRHFSSEINRRIVASHGRPHKDFGRSCPSTYNTVIIYSVLGGCMNLVLNDPGAIHPALWRGTQMGRYAGVCVPTGHEGLDAELPGGGWPQGALVDLLVQQPGVGEMRLLAPALKAVSRLPLMLLNPPPCAEPRGHELLGLTCRER